MSQSAELTTIPLFPLENVVLFPRAQVSLHIFEPRYRLMTHAALESDRRIGMAVVRPEDIEHIAANPPLFDVGCAGEIQRAEELADGRINILLAGTQRFRIEREDEPDEERLYRVGHVRALTDDFDDQDRPRVLELRGDVHELMRELLAIVAPSRVEMFEQQPIVRSDDEVFVNTLSQSIDFAASEKQALLEANTVRERYERLADFMRFRLAELSSGGLSGPVVLQ